MPEEKNFALKYLKDTEKQKKLLSQKLPQLVEGLKR
jgi:hypothetical protein